MKPQSCPHNSLIFGSGDYYVICEDCMRSWVKTAPGTDLADPDNLNHKVAGERRVPERLQTDYSKVRLGDI